MHNLAYGALSIDWPPSKDILVECSLHFSISARDFYIRLSEYDDIETGVILPREHIFSMLALSIDHGEVYLDSRFLLTSQPAMSRGQILLIKLNVKHVTS